MIENKINQARQKNTQNDELKSNRFNLKKFLTKKRIFSSIVIIVFLWIVLSILSSMSAWKAVFLDDKQVFFGKTINVPFTKFITLRRVHYVDSQGQPTPVAGSLEKPDIVISPLSNMVHGPKDTMKINKSHILYYEELRPDTTLVKGLNK